MQSAIPIAAVEVTDIDSNRGARPAAAMADAPNRILSLTELARRGVAPAAHSELAVS